MKKLLSTILCLLVLSPALSRAETITHEFASGFTFTNSNKTATKDGFAYSCSSTAVFGQDLINPAGTKVIALNMPDGSSAATTSTAIENLTRVMISHYPASKCENLKVYISTDGSSWGSALSGDAIEYGNSGIIYAFLPKGNYYLKFANSSSADVSIIQVEYTTEPCVCLKVVSE